MSARFRALLRDGVFLHMPAVYDPIGARLVQSLGFEATYVGGYVTGGSRAITEPLLTMTEQIDVAAEVASQVDIPVVFDAGAGFGEPLHTMRTVAVAIRSGLAGLHIEDQHYPKRAHYHKYQVHTVPRDEWLTKLRMACRERDRLDPNFTIIARTDSCRAEGLDEAVDRLNAAADTGCDIALMFPRSVAEAEAAPRRVRLPMVYVQSRGNRDGRPLFSSGQIRGMGYVACIDAQIVLATAYHFIRKALIELRRTGDTTLLSQAEFVDARQQIEDVVRLNEYYAIEEETVERGGRHAP
jgi:2-methylisocitrate lyase-like PEP mutase family enzyme